MNKTTPTHTPGKWYVYENCPAFEGNPDCIVTDTVEDAVIASMGGDMPEVKENAQYICRAVNAHEALVDALRALTDEFHEMALCAKAGKPPRNIELVEAAEIRARAALSLATQKGDL